MCQPTLTEKARFSGRSSVRARAKRLPVREGPPGHAILPRMLLLLPLAVASPDVPPSLHLQQWNQELRGTEPGTRVGMMVEVADEAPVRIEVWNGKSWLSAKEIFRTEHVAVMHADLGGMRETVRFRSPDRARIRGVDWDLLVPVREPRGIAPPAPGVLPADLAAIGVISRAQWGADATTCTSTEDNWYRMAIHHTAGSQTYGGTVQGAVQALQAYSLGTGEYCDIPYQFLVGYDGSLWEGRPYDYYSGATGGGNNDGNIAISFLGCYHPSGCATSHAVTEEMMAGGQLLVQTLVAKHGIPSNSDSIRGHRDWPGNSTACPGQWLYDRLDELRAPLGPSYAGELVGINFLAPLELQVGEEISGTVELRNTGRQSWTPGQTFLGTTPRDVASGLAGSTWTSGTRAATVSSTVAPGETGIFAFSVRGNTVGPFDQGFGLVQEWVTWFADDGGPADGAIRLTGEVLAPEDPPDSPDSPSPDDSRSVDDSQAVSLGSPVPLDELGACGCDGGAGTFSLPGLLWLLARRRRQSP